MSRTTYRAQSPADLIGTLPTMYGFMPAESLVVLGMQTDNPKRIGMGMRLDLPTEDESVSVAETIDETMKQHGIQHVIVLGLSEDREAAHHRVGMVETVATPTVIFAGVAAAGRFYDQEKWEFGEPDDGEPYGDPNSSAASTLAVTEGQILRRSREEYAAEFAPAPRYDYAEPVIRETLTFEQFTNCTDLELIEYAHTGQGHSAIMGVAQPDNIREVAARLKAAAVKAHPDNAARVYGLAAFAHWLQGDGAGALIAAEQAGQDSLAQTIALAAVGGVDPTKWWDSPQRKEG